ncbi:MAG TPA: GntR family transcriptional regulator [Candidatus Evtepia excrementipullorum]|nr:GntR family transcriptional regulator [Candidatus Evtepia excrementipullorum]
MVSFDDLVLLDGVPIYQQILRHVKLGIAGGTMAPGDALPSRRVVSALLGVNPNTVQKAYRLLEEEGLIQSHPGAKSCVAADEAAQARVRAELLQEQAQQAVAALKRMGLSKDAALELIAQHWEEVP